MLEQKALCHVTVDRQEDTEQPHAVFYHFLDCKRAYLGRNWWPLINGLRCLMVPWPSTQSSILVFTLPNKGSFDWDRGRGRAALSSEADPCQGTEFSS